MRIPFQCITCISVNIFHAYSKKKACDGWIDHRASLSINAEDETQMELEMATHPLLPALWSKKPSLLHTSADSSAQSSWGFRPRSRRRQLRADGTLEGLRPLFLLQALWVEALYI